MPKWYRGVTLRSGRPTRGNRRVTLNRSQFPETHSRPRKAHEISQPLEKRETQPPKYKMTNLQK